LEWKLCEQRKHQQSNKKCTGSSSPEEVCKRHHWSLANGLRNTVTIATWIPSNITYNVNIYTITCYNIQHDTHVSYMLYSNKKKNSNTNRTGIISYVDWSTSVSQSIYTQMYDDGDIWQRNCLVGWTGTSREYEFRWLISSCNNVQ